MVRKASKSETDASEGITIKKYANRRLYNTAASSYVTLGDLAKMVQEGVQFTVHDAKTGEDITRAVLTQIIVEQEAKGDNLLPTGFLRQLISYYGDNLQGLVPQYLDMTMQSFSRNHEQMHSYLENTLGGMYPFTSFEDMSRKNMVAFEQAMNMMTSAPQENTEDPPPTEHAAPGNSDKGGNSDDAIDLLKAQLEAMQEQINSLSTKKMG